MRIAHTQRWVVSIYSGKNFDLQYEGLPDILVDPISLLAWSPDSRYLAVLGSHLSGRTSGMIVNATTGNSYNFGSDLPRENPCDGCGTPMFLRPLLFAWSHNSDELAIFTTHLEDPTRDSAYAFSYGKDALAIIDVADESVRFLPHTYDYHRLSNWNGRGSERIAWSPDDAYIAYAAQKSFAQAGEHDRLYVADVETGATFRLLDDVLPLAGVDQLKKTESIAINHLRWHGEGE